MFYRIMTLFLFLFLNSCCMHWNVSYEPRVANIMNRKFILKQDVFLMTAFTDDRIFSYVPDYVLTIPSRSQRSPISVECYDTYGADWQWHDEMQMYTWTKSHVFPIRANQVRGVVRAGTLIMIVKVEERTLFDNCDQITVFCEILDQKFKNAYCEMDGFFKDVAPFDTSLGVVPLEEYLEPCD